MSKPTITEVMNLVEAVTNVNREQYGRDEVPTLEWMMSAKWLETFIAQAILCEYSTEEMLKRLKKHANSTVEV